jgi:hypothetical protein
MPRALKSISTANLVFALLIVGGYILYGLSCGLSIDKYFLGFTPFAARNQMGPPLPSWKWVAVLEAAVLITAVVGPFAHWDLNLPKALCIWFCFLGLLEILGSSLHSFSYPDGVLPVLKVARFDHPLSVYVWCSHLFYVFCGGGKGWANTSMNATVPIPNCENSRTDSKNND